MHDWRTEIRHRLAAGRVDPANEAEIVEEIAQHLEDQSAELRARGVSEADVDVALLAQLDSPEFARDVLARRRARVATPPAPIGAPSDAASRVASLWQDVRYGLRALRRTPAFTLVAVVSLGLGIGATTAIFGLLHTVLLERLDVSRPEQLIGVQWSAGSKKMVDRLAYDEFRALERAPGLPTLAGFTSDAVVLVARNAREYTSTDEVTGGFFELLGVRPLLGRTISRDDDASSAPVVVISEDLWRNRFEADPAVLGRVVALNDHPFTIIGVLPRSYRGLFFGGAFAMAIPLGARTVLNPPDPRRPGNLVVSVIGRLAAGMTRASAAAALDQTYQQCCATSSRAGAGKPGAIAAGRPVLIAVDAAQGLTSFKVDLRAQYRRILQVLMAGVAIVLLIACANVGNLLLARAAARQRELAIRMSIGATRSRLVRQLLVESLELAVAGGLLGLLLARLGTSTLSHNLPPMAAGLSDRVTLQTSPVILAFTAAITVGCTLLFGVVPAFRATRADIMTPLKDGAKSAGQRWWSLDRGLVVVQVALALILVCAATLFVATLRNLRQFDGGYRSTHVLLANVDTRGTPYESRGMNAVYPDIMARLARVPGVQQVATASTLPVFGGRVSRSRFSIPGYDPLPDEEVASWSNDVSPGFFGATGIALRAGREFDARDTETSEPVTITNESFAKHYFPGRDPIGKSFLDMRIVGVASDARYNDLRAPAEEWFYRPLAQSENGPYLNFALRTTDDPVELAATFTREVETVAPGIRIRRLAGVEQALNDALSRERLSAALATLFGIFALGLAAVGLYGVVAYNVARRTSEIGIRMALGASPTDALWLVVRQTLAMTAVGLGVGAPLALVAARAIGAQLYGIGATDPRALAGAAALLALAGLAASVVPGRRAANVDPVEALRTEG